MKVLLRLVRPGPEGSTEYQDTEISADELSLGSAPDCTVQLLGEQVGLVQDGAPLADGDDVVLGAVEGHELAEPPDAAEIERMPAMKS